MLTTWNFIPIPCTPYGTITESCKQTIIIKLNRPENNYWKQSTNEAVYKCLMQTELHTFFSSFLLLPFYSLLNTTSTVLQQLLQQLCHSPLVCNQMPPCTVTLIIHKFIFIILLSGLDDTLHFFRLICDNFNSSDSL